MKTFAICAALCVVGGWIALSLLTRLPLLVGYLISINFATLLAYAADKSAARADRLRVPERLLHILAALGGSPGALLAQNLLRHKTLKKPFRTWFWSIVSVQALLLAAWIYYRYRQ